MDETQPAAAPDPPPKRGRGKPKGSRGATRKGRKPGPECRYNAHYATLAFDYALARYTNEKIAKLFSISLVTFYNWINKYPNLDKALKKGREQAVGRVSRGMYESAVGYSHDDEQIKITEDGKVYRAKTKKHYPPSVAAASLFLRNHAPEQWQEKVAQEISGPGGEPLVPFVIRIAVPAPAAEQPRPIDVVATAQPAATEPPPLQVDVQAQDAPQTSESGAAAAQPAQPAEAAKSQTSSFLSQEPTLAQAAEMAAAAASKRKGFEAA